MIIPRPDRVKKHDVRKEDMTGKHAFTTFKVTNATSIPNR